MNSTLFERFLEQSEDFIWIVNTDFQLVYTNRAYQHLMKEVTGQVKKLIETVFVGEFGESYNVKYKAYYTRALKGESFEIEERFSHPETDEIQYLLITFKPITNDTNEILVACQAKNITRIVKERSETNQLMDASLDVYCTINELGHFVYVSAAAESHWGYSPQELIGKPYLDLVLEEDVPKTNEIAAAILSGQEINSFTNRYRKKDGTVAFNFWSARWDDDTKLMYCVARDAKEQLEKVELIIHSEQRFKALVQEGSDLIGILDPSGNYLYVSPTSENVLGIDPEFFLGRNAFEFIHPEDAERTLEGLQQITRESRVHLKPFRFQNNKKEWRWVETVLTNMLDNPAVNGIVANSRDITEKISQEERLKQSQKRFESLVENGMDCVLVISPEGKTTYVSGSVKNMLGYSPAEVKGLDIWQMVHPEDVAGSEQALTNSLNHPGVPMKGYTFRIRHKDGSWRWVEPVVTNLLHDPAVRGIVDNFRDITEEKKLKELIKQTNQLAKIGSWEVDLVNQQVYWSEEVHQLHETDPDTYTPNLAEAINFYREDFKQMVQNHVQNSIESGEGFEFEAVIVTAKKNEIWVRSIGTTEFNENQCTRIIGSFQDITERKQAEIALRESEVKFRTIFDIATLGIAQVDPSNGQVILINSYYQTITGYSVAEMLQMNFLELTHPEDREKDWELFSRAARGETEYRNEKRYVKKDGNIVWVRIHVAFIRDENSKPIRTVAICEDITDRKEAEFRLQSLADNLPGVVFQYLIYPDGTDVLRSVTQGAKDIWGFTAEQVEEKNQLVWDQIIAGGEIERVQQSIEESVQSKTNWEAQWKYVMPNGEIRTHLGYGSPRYLADGTVLFNSVILDATEAVKNEALLEQVSRLAKIGSWEVDIAENNVVLSAVAYAIIEADPQAYTPDFESSITLYREDFREMISSKLEDCISNGKSIEYEAVIITLKNNEKWVRVLANAEMHEGQCIRVFGSIQDISSQKETENRLFSIADNIPGVLYQYFIYPDGTDSAKHISGAVEQLWGFSAEQASANINLVWDQIKAGGDYEKTQASIRESIETKTKWTARLKYLMPTGELRTHLGKGTPAFLADGTVMFNSIVLDITQEVKNEQMLEQTTEMARIGSWEMDLINQDGDKMYWSPMIREILEVDENYDANLTGGLEFYSGESSIRINKAMEALIEEGIEFDEELLLITAKGKEQWIRALGKSNRVNGKCVRIYGSFQDIHEIKGVAEKLQKAFKEKNTILESIGDAFFTVDNQWTVTYWNKQAEIVLGRKREDVVGKNLWEEYDDTLDTEFYRQYIEAKKTGKSVYFEEYYATLGIWIEVSAYPSIDGLSVYFKDINSRKIAEEEIEAANERFEKVTEATEDAIWDWDITRDVYYRSQNIKNFFGSHAPSILDQKAFWQDKFHAEDINKVKESIEHSLKDPGIHRWEMEYRIYNENGDELFVKDRGVIIRDERGKPLRMVGAMTDITKQKKLEKTLLELNESLNHYTQELEHSNEELESFAFITSHDLQEPLRMITSFMDLLKRKYGDQLDDKALQYIHYATDGAKRMKQLILDLLQFSRANRPNEGMAMVNLNDVLTQFMHSRRKLIAEHSASIHSDKLPSLKTYPAAMTQIIHGLLDNAIKYSKKGVSPVVEIKAVERENEWEFAIKDNGIGIDSQFFDKIFSLFQRLHNRNEYSGTGVGLSIAKRHVEYLNGRIWLESTPGIGSVFYFTIPKS